MCFVVDPGDKGGAVDGTDFKIQFLYIFRLTNGMIWSGNLIAMR